jgi:hypothetical protein
MGLLQKPNGCSSADASPALCRFRRTDELDIGLSLLGCEANWFQTSNSTLTPCTTACRGRHRFCSRESCANSPRGFPGVDRGRRVGEPQLSRLAIPSARPLERGTRDVNFGKFEPASACVRSETSAELRRSTRVLVAFRSCAVLSDPRWSPNWSRLLRDGRAHWGGWLSIGSAVGVSTTRSASATRACLTGPHRR